MCNGCHSPHCHSNDEDLDELHLLISWASHRISLSVSLQALYSHVSLMSQQRQQLRTPGAEAQCAPQCERRSAARAVRGAAAAVGARRRTHFLRQVVE